MTHYFVDNRAQPDGAHEVHAVGCKRMASDKAYLGDYFSCEQAVVEARKTFWYIAGCVRCMTETETVQAARVSQMHFDFPALRAAAAIGR